MDLKTLVERIDTLDVEAHICCSRTDVSVSTRDYQIVPLDEFDDPVIPAGYRGFLDVWHAIDILKGLEMLDSSTPLIERFVTYLENDA